MPHKDKESSNAYMREYKAKRRLDPAYRESERASDRERYHLNKDETRDERILKNSRYREANRAELAKKERERNERMKNEDPLGFYERNRAKSRKFRNENKDIQEYKDANKRYSALAYAKKKDDPLFKAANSLRAKTWVAENRERSNEGARIRNSKRYKDDIQFKISLCLRRRLYMAVKGMHRSGIAVRELGCSIPEFKHHIEKLFSAGMTWDNWSIKGWHLDHKRPLASFDLTDEIQLMIACHYTNLQPMWSTDNLKKGSNYVE